MKRTAFRYLLGGIALGSELALPELPLAERAINSPPDVNIVIGKVPRVLPQAAEVDAGCFATSSEYLLRVPGVASYRVSNGCEIVVQPDAGAVERDVRGYLLGSIFAVLCHQRGLLPLHASAVAYQGGVAAFLASSGHGKSSVAAHLAGRGFPVVADDVCLVDARTEAPVVVVPVAPWLKLWADSLEHLGLPVAGLEQIFSDEAKYRLPTKYPLDETMPEARRIAKVVFLEGQEEIQSGGSGAVNVEMRRLAPLEALPMLISLTHQSHLLEAMGLRTQNFLQCGRVASQAAIYRLIRPWGLEHMEASIDSIENLLREV